MTNDFLNEVQKCKGLVALDVSGCVNVTVDGLGSLFSCKNKLLTLN